MKDRQKSVQVAIAALIAASSSFSPAQAETAGGCIQPEPQTSVETPDFTLIPLDKSTAVARQKLIDALREMKNKPEAVEFHSAMCYRMAMPPDTIDYSCPTCGKASVYQYQQFPGKVSRQIASIRRSLAELPTSISLDESAMCRNCSKEQPPALRFTSECGRCQKKFNWEIVADKDLHKLDWLFLKFPVKSLDIGAGAGHGSNPELVRDIVDFVSGCIFCSDCRLQLELGKADK